MNDFLPFFRSVVKHKKRIIIFAALTLLVFQFALQIHLASTDSQTTDEAVHISAGYTYLTKHDFRFNPEHPPLVKIMAALPLLFLHLNEPHNTSLWDQSAPFLYDSWKENRWYGTAFLYTSGNNADLILFWARLPITILTLLLGLAIFLISRRFFGDMGALLSLSLYVFNPTITAHGHLVTTDIAVALTFTLSLYLLYNALTRPSKKTWIMFGVMLGVAQLTKFTAIILIPIAILAIVVALIHHKSGRVRSTILGGVIIASVVAWFIIWVGYGFNYTRGPEQLSVTTAIAKQNLASSENPEQYRRTGTDKLYTYLRPILVPRDYAKGLAMIIGHVENGHDSYLLGHTSKTGWWYYFPVVFVTKTPVSSLILLVCAIYLLVKNKKKYPGALFLLSGAVLFLVFAMTSKANLGVRHIMPFLPGLIIATGVLATLKWRWSRVIMSALLILLMAEFVMISPHFLSYFNQLAGGSYNGSAIASDSNLDWGQELKYIQSYVATSCTTPPYILYSWNGNEALDYYGIPHQPSSALRPGAVGTLIASTSNLTEPRYAWIKQLTPVKKLSPAVFVYQLTGNEK